MNGCSPEMRRERISHWKESWPSGCGGIQKSEKNCGNGWKKAPGLIATSDAFDQALSIIISLKTQLSIN